MNRWLMRGVVIAGLSMVCANEAAAQPSGPLVPAITPEQVKASEAQAAKYDLVNRPRKGAARNVSQSSARVGHSEGVRCERELPDDGGADDA